MNSGNSHTVSTKTSLAVQIIFVAAVIGGVFAFDKFVNVSRNPDSNGVVGKATLSIDFADMKKMFEGQVVADMTVLDALNAAMSAGKIHLVYTVDQNNDTDVREINGHSESNDVQFAFYINSNKINEADINRQIVKNGDEITIRLE